MVLVLGSVGLLVAAAYAALARFGATEVDLGAHGTYHSDHYGVATNDTDWRTTFFGWAGSVQLEVASTGQAPLFVGVAAPEELGPYLSDIAHTTFEETSSLGVVRTDHGGKAPSDPPASSIEWTARSEGVGRRTLHWDASDGRQIAFAMNADGSRPVDVEVVSSAITLERMPWWIPAATLVLSMILLLLGIVVLRRAIRPGRRTGWASTRL